MTRRRLSWAPFCFLLHYALAGCSPPQRPSDTELYGLAIERVRRALGQPAELSIHPLPAQWGSRDALYAPLTGFNVYDSTSIPQIVAADSALHLCKPSAAGICDEEAATPTIVLSDLRELGEKSVGLRLMVSRHRPGGRFQRNYFVRLASGLRGWSVVEFREVPSAPRGTQ